MQKNFQKAKGEWNEKRVFLIKEVLNKMKKDIKNVSENEKFKIKENQKIIDIV